MLKMLLSTVHIMVLLWYFWYEMSDAAVADSGIGEKGREGGDEMRSTQLRIRPRRK